MTILTETEKQNLVRDRVLNIANHLNNLFGFCNVKRRNWIEMLIDINNSECDAECKMDVIDNLFNDIKKDILIQVKALKSQRANIA